MEIDLHGAGNAESLCQLTLFNIKPYSPTDGSMEDAARSTRIDNRIESL